MPSFTSYNCKWLLRKYIARQLDWRNMQKEVAYIWELAVILFDTL